MSIAYARLEYDDGDRHRKFWQVEVVDLGVSCLVKAEWGKLNGTGGQSQIKTFSSREAAEKHAASMVKQKRRKGYEDAGMIGECGP